MTITKVSYTFFTAAVVTAMITVYHGDAAVLSYRSGIDYNKRTEKHPCDDVKNNTIVHTLTGDVMCRLPSSEKLTRRLDVVGGYNRHYVSQTLKEAQVNFKNLFQTYGKNFSNTTEWQSWHLSDVSLMKEDGGQTSSLDGSLALQKRESKGNSTVIQCLAGGRETAAGIHFCPACQRCTEMPPNVFPRYINELTCDDSQNESSSKPGCFLGGSFQIGSCSQIMMTIDLLSHQNGNYVLTFENETIKMYEAVYDKITQELSISCECLGFPGLMKGQT